MSALVSVVGEPDDALVGSVGNMKHKGADHEQRD